MTVHELFYPLFQNEIYIILLARKVYFRVTKSAVHAFTPYIFFEISLILWKSAINLTWMSPSLHNEYLIFHCPHKEKITQNLFFKCLYFFFNFFLGDFYFNTKWWQLKLCEIKHINNNYNWRMAQTFPAHKLRITWSQRHFFWNFKNRMLKNKISPLPPTHGKYAK